MKQEPGNASSQESPGFSRGEEVNMLYRYPRWRIKQRRGGWHIWWIPANAPIKRVHVAESFEDAVLHIDMLRHREPS